MMSRGSTSNPRGKDLRDANWVFVGILYARYAELTKQETASFFDLTCYTCDFIANSVKDYQLHLLLQHLKSDRDEWGMVSCPHCNDNFESSQCYRKHLDIVHPNTPNLRYCVFCAFTACSRDGYSSKHLADRHVLNVHLKRICNIGDGYNDVFLIYNILKDCITKQNAARAKRDSVIRTENITRACKTIDWENEILVSPPLFTSTPMKDRSAANGMAETARDTNEQGPLSPASAAPSPMENPPARIGRTEIAPDTRGQSFLPPALAGSSSMEDHPASIAIKETKRDTNEQSALFPVSVASTQIRNQSAEIGLNEIARVNFDQCPISPALSAPTLIEDQSARIGMKETKQVTNEQDNLSSAFSASSPMEDQSGRIAIEDTSRDTSEQGVISSVLAASSRMTNQSAKIGMNETTRVPFEQYPLSPAFSASTPMEVQLARISMKETKRVANEQGNLSPAFFLSSPMANQWGRIANEETSRDPNEQSAFPFVLAASSQMEDQSNRIAKKETSQDTNEQGALSPVLAASSQMEDQSGRIDMEETERVTNETTSSSGNQRIKSNTKIVRGIKRRAVRSRVNGPVLRDRKSSVRQVTLDGSDRNSRSTRFSSLSVLRVSVAHSTDPERSKMATGNLCKKQSLSGGTGDNCEQAKKKRYKEQDMYNKETILAAVKAIKQTRTIMCPFCPLKFPNIGKNLFTHLVNAHLETQRTPEGFIQCSRCVETFISESSYRSHFQKHNTQTLCCRLCPFEDPDRYCATNHFIDSHFNELAELSHRKALTNKIKSKVFFEKNDIRCRLAKELAVTKPLKQCPFCVYTNESKRGIYNLRQHLLVSHLANDRTPDGKIQCPHCQELFNLDPDFRKHLKKEQSGRGMFCPHCSYKGKSHDQLNSHIRINHSDALMPEILLGISLTKASCNRNPISKMC